MKPEASAADLTLTLTQALQQSLGLPEDVATPMAEHLVRWLVQADPSAFQRGTPAGQQPGHSDPHPGAEKQPGKTNSKAIVGVELKRQVTEKKGYFGQLFQKIPQKSFTTPAVIACNYQLPATHCKSQSARQPPHDPEPSI